MIVSATVNSAKAIIYTKAGNGIQASFTVCLGDITELKVDAIVNAANCRLLGGGGVDGAIHRAAGPGLLEECKTLNGCATGEAKITKGYNLKAKYVIHTPGPQGEYPKLLENSYMNSLNLVKQNHLESVAFPCISTGVYGYDFERATKVALYSVRKWIQENGESTPNMHIYFCTHNRSDFDFYNDTIVKVFKFQSGDMKS
ncbi:hypothetical protein BB558_001466 [Smittium angustum]|uniref:Macro domain-containing protein n=1 Tax=Smittium angustum TaxID=133377 RepID=A0A2U1JBC1_SMIAN|nr:hypothetical protein BB558_001466 [Smittium angustum]